MTNKENEIIIFTDGASKGNPGPGGWAAVVIQNNSGELKGQVTELGGGEKHTTNNRMELTSAVKALEEIRQRRMSTGGEVIVYTDSKYLIGGMTGWIYGWQKNGWKTKDRREVLNRDLWEKLAGLIKDKKVKWNYIGGHIGVAGNERCDEIASALATGEKVDLYKGKLEKYKIDILNIEHNRPGYQNNHPALTKAGKGAKAYSYLSLVNGILNIDKTWAECEKRVKGQKAAKFKKALSLEDEKEIIRIWGQHE